ncbi:Mitochondrial substrate carrier family protein [Klebsormidium nitens]|uniref:Mitochondrial substrate carrier family protein n=1 Tax=Klebsormidium nitens TaxID=105231 RepID=A0A1Y1HPE5_KLENI|nr:Mitochondrial substrate carrier family protein [Klebsormidium nitens]|eukprot:GAQ79652.1 Mitochondrial substrate carrier family protein [Klebsormidium nitens]
MKDYAWISLLAGCLAGICETIVGFPFDTVKTRLQAASKDGVEGLTYRGPWDCVVSKFKTEGILGFYRGVTPPLVQEALGVAFLYGARDWLREHLNATLQNPPALVLSCCLIGLGESIIYCPLDHLKARLQVACVSSEDEDVRLLELGGSNPDKMVADAGPEKEDPKARSESLGVIECAKEILRANGWRGLYLGWPIQVAKEMLGNVALFSTYDLVLSFFGAADMNGPAHGHPVGESWLAIWPAGSLAGMAYYTVNYPLDAIKTRLQTDSLIQPKYRGSADCVWKVTQHELGFFELYRGLSMCLARAIPGCAVQFFVFELVFRTFFRSS